ncbi:hypothetical protein BO71DRAFT_433122 [Aspergillus ellipticus CBS 707.79]|uniref:Uncharacterized protein n=1 Tax=Aspergillus ellipticus CBS 707.79 TaxID=1448320 RepID=A0A319D0V5_9EURO|nr:hypothetical protein BO71DRAFT_433122 [Aspergillus ellipticus CBS 707.79]
MHQLPPATAGLPTPTSSPSRGTRRGAPGDGVSVHVSCIFVTGQADKPQVTSTSGSKGLNAGWAIAAVCAWAYSGVHPGGAGWLGRMHIYGIKSEALVAAALLLPRHHRAAAPAVPQDMPDFTRYAHTPRQIPWAQALGLILLVSLCGILGATVTSATETIYGVGTWNPLQVAQLWDNRAAPFFAALCRSLAAVGTTLSANSVSFANDLSLWFSALSLVYSE